MTGSTRRWVWVGRSTRPNAQTSHKRCQPPTVQLPTPNFQLPTANRATQDDVSCRPDFSILVYPWMIVDENDAANAGTLAKEIGVDATTPSAFLAHAADDPTAPWQNTYTYFSKLQGSMENAAGARMGVYPTGGHGFAMCQ